MQRVAVLTASEVERLLLLSSLYPIVRTEGFRKGFLDALVAWPKVPRQGEEEYRMGVEIASEFLEERAPIHVETRAVNYKEQVTYKNFEEVKKCLFDLLDNGVNISRSITIASEKCGVGKRTIYAWISKGREQHEGDLAEFVDKLSRITKR